MRYLVFLLCFLLAFPSFAAMEEEPAYKTETYSFSTIVGAIPEYTKTPEGGIDWALFSRTKQIPYSIEKEGETWEGVKPEFSDEIKNLEGKKIKMTGYMFPLDQSEEQSKFLFGPFPLTCPYHYHASASLTIEAHAEKPILFNYDPVTIEGVLELVPEDFEYNTFYRLKDVQMP